MTVLSVIYLLPKFELEMIGAAIFYLLEATFTEIVTLNNYY